MKYLKMVTELREFMILLIILVLGIFMTVQSPFFLTPENLMAILLGLSIESIVAIGMTILLVAGGFDLSVGSILALSSAIAAMCMKTGYSVPVSILAGLGLGTAIGLINGLIIARLRINAFVTTLAMMSIARGALMVITKANNISGLPPSFNILGQGKLSLFAPAPAEVGQLAPHGLIQIQYPIIIAAVMVIAGDLLLRKSRFLRQNYYIGGNEKAAVLSGINVSRLTVFNYALTGFLAALAGIIMTARFGSASVNAGTGLELKVITAVIIGGASLQGGEGTVLGAFLGTLLMGIIVNSLTLLGVDVYWNTLVIGATLLIAVMIDTAGKRRKGMF